MQIAVENEKRVKEWEGKIEEKMQELRMLQEEYKLEGPIKLAIESMEKSMKERYESRISSLMQQVLQS
jgi:hypothetical protein